MAINLHGGGFHCRIQEAKTQNVHLRPYHDPTKLKSREDVEMRILYKGPNSTIGRNPDFWGDQGDPKN